MTYDPVIATVAAQPLAAVTARVRSDQLGQVVFNALDRVHAVVRAGDYGPYGSDVVLCEGESEEGVLDLRIGVVLAGPFPGVGAIVPWTTPAGEAVRVTHLGPYSELGMAHVVAKNAVQRLGRRLTGVHWEVHGPFIPAARARQTDVFYEAAHG